MSVSFKELAAAAASILSPLVALYVRSNRQHARLRDINARLGVVKDLEARAAPSAALMTELIDENVAAYVAEERLRASRKRDPFAPVVAVLFLIPIAPVLYFAWPAGGFWRAVGLILSVSWLWTVAVATHQTSWKTVVPDGEGGTNEERDSTPN